MVLSSKAQKRLFIFGSFVVVLLAVLLYWRINALVSSFKEISDTNKVELSLENLLLSLREAESAQRGFLITHDSAYLENYQNARPHIDSVLTEIGKVTHNIPKQQQNLVSIRSLIDYRFYLLNSTIQKSFVAPDSLDMALKRGVMSMERIKDQLEQIRNAEKDVLTERENIKDLYLKLTPMSLLFLVFAILMILGFSYYGLTKQLQQTRTYAADLDYLNNELLLKNKQLENSVEELNSFNYIASHDLKEPLRKILFFTDIINNNKQPPLPTEVKQQIDKIHVAGTRMKNLLDDLLVYAQASMGERKIELIDVNHLLDAVVENLSEVLKEKEATVVYKDLPSIKAVPSQLAQLFENLITNAVKYSREGIPPLITIRSTIIPKREMPSSFETAHDWYHHILFSDNGIGFTQDNADKIFVLFQRLHQRNEFSGTGIGLTICKKIVQNHDGFITAASEVNKGTTFSIYLPA